MKLERIRSQTRYIFKKIVKISNKTWAVNAEARDKYRLGIRKGQQDSWVTICNEVGRAPEKARLGRIFSENPEAVLVTLKLSNGEYSTTNE